MVKILPGCNIKPVQAVVNRLPANLVDDTYYRELLGSYGKPLPEEMTPLKGECIARGKDVINLITSIKYNNVEMKALRELNSE